MPAMRITGMSSGMDVEAMVTELMRAERAPLENLQKKRTTFNWKTDQYRELNSQLLSLRTNLFDFRFSSNWSMNKTGSSNETFVKATASGQATPGTHTIEVLDLAGNATKTSAAQLSNTGLQGQNAAGLTIDDTKNEFNVTLDGVTRKITINASATYATHNDLQAEIQSKINSAFGPNTIAVSVNGSGQFSFTPQGYNSGGVDNRPQLTLSAVKDDTGLANLGFDLTTVSRPSFKLDVGSKIDELIAGGKFKTDPTASSGSFTINGVAISYSGTDTLESIISKVNNSKAGVQMNYDAVADKVTIQTRTMGSAAKVDISSDTGGLMAALGLDSTAATGKDAEVKIDGVTSFRNSNSVSVNGVTYDLLQKTTAPVTVTVGSDTNAMVDKISEFVKKYNEVVDAFNKRVKEQKFRSYTPLTDEQKADMNEKDVELWEERAKSGLLANDSLLKSILGDMRTTLYKTVSSVSNTSKDALYEIGIETVAYNNDAPNDAGKLKIDDAKLRKAIEEDPQSVINLFTNKSTAESGKGIAERLYERVNKAIEALIDKAGGIGTAVNNINTSLGSEINSLDRKINRMEALLVTKENNYYKKFTAMETAMQKSSAQAAWLSAQLGG